MRFQNSNIIPAKYHMNSRDQTPPTLMDSRLPHARQSTSPSGSASRKRENNPKRNRLTPSPQKSNKGNRTQSRGGKPGVALGLDIGTSSLKIIVLEKRKPGIVLSYWKIYKYHSTKNRQEEIAHFLTQFFSSHKVLKKVPVYTSLISNTFLLRYLVLPQMSDANFMKSASLEMQSELFFEDKKIKLFTYPYPEKKNNLQQKKTGIALAVEETLLDDTLSLLKKVNLKITCLNIDTLAIANLIPDSEGQPVALIDFGAEKLKIVIIFQNQIRFARNVDSYEPKIINELSEMLDLEFEGAEKLKQDISLSVTPVNMVYSGIDQFRGDIGSPQYIAFPLLSQMAEDIKLTLEYYNSNNDQRVELLKIIGGGALQNGLTHFLTEVIGIPVSILDPVRDSGIILPQAQAEKLAGIAPSLATAIGLAKFEFNDSKVLKVDLRKKIKAKRQNFRLKAKLGIVAALFVGALLIGFYFFLETKTDAYRTRNSQLRSLIEDFRTSIENLEEYDELNNNIKIQVADITALKQTQPQWSIILKEFSANVPESFWIDQFKGTLVARETREDHDYPESEDDPNEIPDDTSPENQRAESENRLSFLAISFQGRTENPNAVQEFIANLEKSRQFSYVNFNKISSHIGENGNETHFSVEGKIQLTNPTESEK